MFKATKVTELALVCSLAIVFTGLLIQQIVLMTQGNEGADLRLLGIAVICMLACVGILGLLVLNMRRDKREGMQNEVSVE